MGDLIPITDHHRPFFTPSCDNNPWSSQALWRGHITICSLSYTTSRNPNRLFVLSGLVHTLFFVWVGLFGSANCVALPHTADIIRWCITFEVKVQCNMHTADPKYHKISNIRRTKSPNLNVSRPVLQLSLPNPMKPGLKSRMKMKLEQRRQPMLQLHLSDRQFCCLLRCGFY